MSRVQRRFEEDNKKIIFKFHVPVSCLIWYTLLQSFTCTTIVSSNQHHTYKGCSSSSSSFSSSSYNFFKETPHNLFLFLILFNIKPVSLLDLTLTTKLNHVCVCVCVLMSMFTLTQTHTHNIIMYNIMKRVKFKSCNNNHHCYYYVFFVVK